MLTELRIKNFAIIESLSLPLARGFNVLSGETGAGKSIIVGALGLLLGERASADLIRTGSDRASVEGVFDLAGREEVARALDERGIEVDEHTVVLKREIAAGGRTRAWVNGSAVTAHVLAEVGRQLVNLHGQHEAQTLLDAESQRRILDAFGGAGAHAERVREAAGELAAVREERRTLSARRAEAERRADYLRHVSRRSRTPSCRRARTSASRRKRAAWSMPTSCARSREPPPDSSRTARRACCTSSRRCTARSRAWSASIRRSHACRSSTTTASTRSRSCRASWSSTSAPWSSIPTASPRCSAAGI
jgi:chromosome segregation ATPase